MNLINYDSMRRDSIAQKMQISKEYNIAGLATGEVSMKITGQKGKRIFDNEKFAQLKNKPAGELHITELKELMKQTIIDISSEQAQKPPIYTNIYEEIKDSSFPASLQVKDVIGLQTAFSIVGDGQAVPLADFRVDDMGTVYFKTFATGYSVTEEWVAFNQFWKVEMANKAIAQAYNAILDHIHLSPIIKATYGADKETGKATISGATPLVTVYNSLRNGIKDAMRRRTARGGILRPSVALCNSSTALDVLSAIKGETEKGKTLGSIGMIENVISYDGWVGEVNGIKYEFGAPADNEVFLIEPKRGFKALVKKEITKIEQKGNVLTLGNLDVVEFFMRAVVADVANSVHKVMVG